MILSYRLLPPRYDTEPQFTQLLAFLRRHQPAVDEISLFTEYWHHGYYPLDRFGQLADILRDRIDRLHGIGVRSVGINMLDTIGHTNEAWDFLPPLPFAPMVGHDGSVSRSCACPNDPVFRQYIDEKYRLIARAAPDFIWVDDDIRVHHHGVAWGCFCHRCLAKFSQGDDRAAVVAALERPENGALRVAWVEQNAATLEDLLRQIGQTIRRVSQRIEIGLMTCGPAWTTYSGQALARWMTALGATRMRPGGGFYDDRAPNDMFGKAMDIGRQCVTATPQVRHIAYELENFPYHKLDKSVSTVMNECLLALANGCDGIAFNCMKDLPGELDDYDDLLNAIQRHRPLWEAFVEAARGLPMAGLWPAFTDDWSARRPVPPGTSWFGYAHGFNIGQINGLAEIGLPLTSDRRGATATVLWGDVASILPDDDLRCILASGVILDPPALQALHDRGLGEHAGVSLGKSYDNGVWERLTDHAMNGPFAGDGRDVRVSFWPAHARQLLPLADGVQVLARMVGYNGDDCGACLTLHANRLGGRVAVLGYAPWHRLGNSAKRAQMLAIADWVSGGRLPLRIDRTVRVVPMVRMAADGTCFAADLVNASFDTSGPIVIRVRASAREVTMLGPDGPLPITVRRDGDELCVESRGIEPWRSVALLGA